MDRLIDIIERVYLGQPSTPVEKAIYLATGTVICGGGLLLLKSLGEATGLLSTPAAQAQAQALAQAPEPSVDGPVRSGGAYSYIPLDLGGSYV